MPISFGIPLGLSITLAGAILFYTKRNKKLAKIILGIGSGMTLLTLGIIVLAVNASM